MPYIYRHPGAGADKIISCEGEAFSRDVARELGIGRTSVFGDPKTGWKISKFIDGCAEFDYHNPSHVKAAMEIARKLHSSDAVSPWEFDVYAKMREIVRLLGRVGFNGFDELSRCADRLNECVKANGASLVLCRNDFCSPHFLVFADGMCLADCLLNGAVTEACFQVVDVIA